MKTKPCENCPIKPYAAVSAHGPVPNRLVFVGQRPGVVELAHGQPFIGPTGKLLRSVLQKLNLDDQRFFYTNVVKCRAPRDAPPTEEEVRACKTWLVDDLEQACGEGTVLVLLGNEAIQTVYNDESLKITSERGEIRTVSLPSGKTVRAISTFHPSYILRKPGEFKKFAMDMHKIATLAREEPPKSGDYGAKGYYVVKATERDVIRAVNAVLKYDLVAADIETDGYNPRKNSILCLGVSVGKGKVLIFPEEVLYTDTFRPHLMRMFESDHIKWIWHNGKFDSAFLRTAGFPARVDEDTILMHYILDENSKHDLKILSMTYCGAVDYEDIVRSFLVHKKKDSYRLVPKHILYFYAAYDVAYTLDLYFIFRDKLQKDERLTHAYKKVVLPASEFLQGVEAAGMYLNLGYMNELKETLTKRVTDEENKLLPLIEHLWDPEEYAEATNRKKVPNKLNLNSPPQMNFLLYDKLRLPVIHMSKKGRQVAIRTTREQVLRKVKERIPPDSPGVKVIDTLLEMRGYKKQVDTYVKGWMRGVESDGRVHPSYLLHGTVTGRLSSREPNAQNVPRDNVIRDIVCAPPGSILMEIDYSQAELRVVSYIAKDRALRQVFLDERDLHDEVTLRLFGPGFTKDQRVRGKGVSFGLIYGRGAKSLAEEFRVAVQEAQRWVNEWFALFPEVRAHMRLQVQKAYTGVPLVTPLGRKRRFGLITDSNAMDVNGQAMNFEIQSTASDLTLLSGMHLSQLLPEHSKIINIVHDSILIEIKQDPEGRNAYETGQLAIKVMEEIPYKYLGGLDFPFTADAKTGYKWGSLKEISKKELSSIEEIQRFLQAKTTEKTIWTSSQQEASSLRVQAGGR